MRIDPADGPVQEREIDSDSLVIGRSSSSDLSLPDPFLSRFHARIYRENGKVFIEDLGSRNGTLLNGVAIAKPTTIEPGDEIKVSGSVIQIKDDNAMDTATGSSITDLGATIFRPATELLAEDSKTHPGEVEGDELRRYAERLKLFNEIHEALSSSIEQDELLELILDRAFDHLKPEEGAIYLGNEEQGYDCAALRHVDGAAKESPLSRNLIHEVCGKGMAALVLDAMTDARFAQAESIIMAGVRSLIAAPMLDGDSSLGMIMLSTRAGAEQFSESDLEFLVSMASVAALKIRNAALVEEANERRRLQDQLNLARRIQINLLPDRLPDIPTLELYAENVPSLGVSGDYYMVIERNEGKECVLMVVDVSGKGVPASLLTHTLEALTAAPIEDGLPCDVICRRVSRQLFQRTPPEKYATLFIATVEPETGLLRYTNAGHNPALVLRHDDSVERLGTCGMPVGLVAEAEYTMQELTLGAGEAVLIYTDGITEAENPQEEEYGIERLEAAFRENRTTDLEKLAEAIHKDLDAFADGTRYHDDRTFVIARRR